MNRNPTWKYLLLLVIVAFGVIYATPNLYQAEPGVQVIGVRKAEVNAQTLGRVTRALETNSIEVKSISLENDVIRARLFSEDDQSRAQSVLRVAMGSNYPVALADMTTTPEWLRNLGGAPMFLGLDLRGGVHFLLQVDMQAAEKKSRDNYYDDLRTLFREQRLYNQGMTRNDSGAVVVKFKEESVRDEAFNQVSLNSPELQIIDSEANGAYLLTLQLTESAVKEIHDSALKKNMLALRNRIDQLGVSEPIIQQQGTDRIVIQLPGVRDPSEAKKILGKTATLEVRMVDEENALESNIRGRVPAGSKRFYYRDKTPILLKKRMLFSGDNIVNAQAGFDTQSGGQIVSITLDAKAATINSDITGKNIGKRMAVVYVEDLTETKLDADGNEKTVRKRIEEVITAPVIRDQLGKRFQITGLNEPGEAQELSLLLRAGSLAAPVYIVEERTVGPSLGQENIEKGFKSVFYGFIAVLLFMVVYYRVFGTVASFALILNLVVIVGVLSLLQATLTLPGVAGMVLTVGMAVDANVLIFERIREEIKSGAAPQMAIHRGYDNAFSTIIDANLTTLIAALVLFNFGTGPIQGFAITLSIGIATSMVTAIFVSRILINFIYGKRRLESLAI
jgi:preprotein translocase subunit SecD